MPKETSATHEHIELSHNSDIRFVLFHASDIYVMSHWHNALEVNFVLDGTFEVTTDGQISKIASLQPEYFCRFFKKHMGCTYLEYINEIRLSHIYHDLSATDHPLYQLLEMHGFKNYKMFRRMFQEHFHTTPGALRKELRNQKYQ